MTRRARDRFSRPGIDSPHARRAAVFATLTVALACGGAEDGNGEAADGAGGASGEAGRGGGNGEACTPVDGILPSGSDTLTVGPGGWSARDKAGPGPTSRAAFYLPPDPLPAGAPGEVIRSESVEGVDGIGSVRVTRMLYHSTSLDCRDVAVSGVVLEPPGTAPPGGWPILAWAHGTSGVGDVCAPSMWRDFFEYAETMLGLANAGFVIAATDYEGLGTPGAHPYLDKEVEAHGVVDAVRAARRLLTTTSKQWLAIGHSQGGQAALAAAEGAADRAPELELAGAVGIAPAPSIRFVPLLASSPENAGYVAFLAAGVLALNRSLALADLMGPAAVARAGLMDTGCWYEVIDGYGAIDAAEFEPPTAAGTDAREAFFARNDAGDRPIGKPVLLVQGDADATVPAAITRNLHDTLCAAGESVRLDAYAGEGHDSVLPISFDATVEWIRARIAGESAPSDCGG